MVLGRDPTFFHPSVVDVLKLGDGNPYSKKDSTIRRQEVLAAISSSLVEHIVRSVEYWSRNQQWTLFLGAAIAVLPTREHKQQALKALAQHIGLEAPDSVKSLVDIAHAIKMISYCISKDVENKKNKMPLFSLLLIKYAEKVGHQFYYIYFIMFICPKRL